MIYTLAMAGPLLRPGARAFYNGGRYMGKISGAIELQRGPVRVRSVRKESGELEDFCLSALPAGNFKTILIKPNWVKHQEDPAFPIAALVTSTDLIESVIEACLRKYPG